MKLLLDRLFSAIALSHFAVDIMNGQRAILLTYLSASLGLTNTTLGMASTLYTVAGSITQPVFGWLTDKWGTRWMSAGGLLWMAVFFSLALIVPGPAALWLLMLAPLGSAAYHPAGTLQATLRGREAFAGRETTASAAFFVFGNAGLFLGPLLAGPILDRFGLPGLLGLTALSFPVALNAAYQLRPVEPVLTLTPQPLAFGSGLAPQRSTSVTVPGPAPVSRASAAALAGSAAADSTAVDPPASVVQSEAASLTGFARYAPIMVLAIVAAFQAWSQQNMNTFLPKYLSDLGANPSVYGLIASLFMGGSTVGTLLGGAAADRFGKRLVIFCALVLAAAPLALVGVVGWSNWLYLIVPLSGALTGSVHSIVVVLAQRQIPGRMALASGLVLGFMFSAGAVGSLFSGILADVLGFPPVFLLTGAIALTGGILALRLKDAN